MKRLRHFYVAFTASLLLILIFSFNAYAANDISGHWAQSQIQSLINKGDVSSYPDGTFKPDNNITRAEFMIIINNVFGYFNETDINFTDVSDTDWYYRPIAVAVGSGYINGYSDNTMRPNRTITREEAAVIITNLLGVSPSESGANNFGDQGAMSWSKPYVGAAVNSGVLKGYTDGNFKPQRNMTRAEAVVAITSTFNEKVNGNNKDNTTPPPVEVPTTPSTDTDKNTTDSKDIGLTISSSSYGPNSGKDTVRENTEVTNTSTTDIKNVTFTKDVYIASKSGRVNFNNVTINGTLYTDSGSRITLTDTEVERIVVNKDASTPHIYATGYTSAPLVYLSAGATLEETSLQSSYKAFEKVYIEKAAAESSKYNFYGDFDLIEVSAYRVNLYLNKGTITDLYIGADASRTAVSLDNDTTVKNADIFGERSSISGKGKLTKANVRADNVVLERKPETLTGTYVPSYEDSTESYDVTIKVRDSSGVLKDASVSISGVSGSKSTDSSGEAVFKNVPVKSSSYTVTVSKSGYGTETTTITVSNKDITSTVTLSTGYTINFNVTNASTGNGINGATITFDGRSLSTNSSGNVSFTGVSTGTKSYTIKAGGYQDYSSSVNVNGTKTESPRMTPAVTTATSAVTITVQDSSGNAISGASVELGGKNATTGSDGKATINGITYSGSGTTYTYSASHSDYITNSRSITVNSATASSTIQLTAKVTTPDPGPGPGDGGGDQGGSGGGDEGGDGGSESTEPPEQPTP